MKIHSIDTQWRYKVEIPGIVIVEIHGGDTWYRYIVEVHSIDTRWRYIL